MTVRAPGAACSPSLWMLLGSLCFAAMAALTHALGPRCDWLVVGLVRAVFMFTTTAALARLAGVRLVLWKPRTLWVRSLAGSFSLVCNFYAMTHLPVANALTLSNTYPLWIIALAGLVWNQWPTLGEWLGVCCGLAGVVLIQQPHFNADRTATLVALLSAASTAVALLGLHRLGQVDSRAVVAHFAGVASVVAAAGLALRPDAFNPRMLEPLSLALLLGVAVSGTVGQHCLTRAYTRGKPTRLAVVGLSQIVFALGFDLWLWHRALRPTAALGFVLVAVPSALLGGVAARKFTRPAAAAAQNRAATARPAVPASPPASP